MTTTAQQKEYLLKLSSVPQNGEKTEASIVGLDGDDNNAKILLLRVNGALRAVGPRCTHYGAPLVKGVLSADGRLTCPWHGACFSTADGCVENAPALDYLSSFHVEERDGAVYVRGDEAALKAGSRVPDVTVSVRSNERVVIVGGGSGALGAIEGLREKGYSGQITVVSKEEYYPIDRTKLSKALIPDLKKITWRDSDFYKAAAVDFHLGKSVKSVDFAAKKLLGENGEEWVYDKVIFATGGTPKRLPMTGFKTLGNVFTLRGMDDVNAILKALGDDGKKVVIIGSSFIGMEVGKCLSGKKNSVTIIGMDSAPLERVMGAEVGRIFQRQLEKSGVKFYLGASVDDAEPSSTDASLVGSVALKNGENIPADLVILGVGVAPATEYLKSSGVKLEADSSVRVDDHWRIQGVEDAYAIGDIATYPHNGGMVRIEHWNVAQNGGRQVGRHIANKRKPVPFTPIFWSALGAQLRYCGNTQGNDQYDDVIVTGEPDKNKWVAYYTQGERVVAVASQGADPVVMQSAELMRRGKMISKSEIKQGKSPLEVYPPATIVGA
ncbi:hypothetical protein FN846DRAFT_779545 [Sphaerosporella brunnea]|uniref:Rieske domain-containing protein n=1 Tax=Sphaerosporella brunnea TaxID=1250544 RepID=A0A5J5EV87_9PEZI|nr:hypothetical protein FN846DRAFT_779545 [Sphaerosporella brunnea]